MAGQSSETPATSCCTRHSRSGALSAVAVLAIVVSLTFTNIYSFENETKNDVIKFRNVASNGKDAQIIDATSRVIVPNNTGLGKATKPPKQHQTAEHETDPENRVVPIVTHATTPTSVPASQSITSDTSNEPPSAGYWTEMESLGEDLTPQVRLFLKGPQTTSQTPMIPPPPPISTIKGKSTGETYYPDNSFSAPFGKFLKAKKLTLFTTLISKSFDEAKNRQKHHIQINTIMAGMKLAPDGEMVIFTDDPHIVFLFEACLDPALADLWRVRLRAMCDNTNRYTKDNTPTLTRNWCDSVGSSSKLRGRQSNYAPALYSDGKCGCVGCLVVVPEQGSNPHGTPYFANMFRWIEQYSTAEMMGYTNADMLYSSTLLDAVDTTIEGISSGILKKKTLLVGRRTNLSFPKDFNLKSDWMIKPDWTQPQIVNLLNELQKKKGAVLFMPQAEDYFITTKGTFDWSTFKPCVIGRPGYDNYIVDIMWKRPDVAVVDATEYVIALHQTDVSGNWAGHRGILKDVKWNLKIAPPPFPHGKTTTVPFELRHVCIDDKTTREALLSYTIPFLFDKHREYGSLWAANGRVLPADHSVLVTPDSVTFHKAASCTDRAILVGRVPSDTWLPRDYIKVKNILKSLESKK